MSRRKGKATWSNVIVHSNGTTSVPFSTNSLTSDEYFTVDTERLSVVLGRSWRAHNDSSHKGRMHINIRTGNSKTGTFLLHRELFEAELQDTELEVDHILHWTDNRASSVEFVEKSENVRRGAAVYHRGRKNRST